MFAAGRVASSLRIRVRERAREMRTGLEAFATERFGMRPSDRALFLRMQHELRAAGMRYEPPELDVEITVYLGEDASEHWRSVMTREWGAVAGGGLDVVTVDGSHIDNTMLLEPDVSSIAASVDASLGALDDR